MLLSDVDVLNRSFVQHPPVDLLVAAYLGYKSPELSSGKVNPHHARQLNSGVLATPGFTSAKMKTIDQMPEFIRSPAKMELIARMKQEMTG